MYIATNAQLHRYRRAISVNNLPVGYLRCSKRGVNADDKKRCVQRPLKALYNTFSSGNKLDRRALMIRLTPPSNHEVMHSNRSPMDSIRNISAIYHYSTRKRWRKIQENTKKFEDHVTCMKGASLVLYFYHTGLKDSRKWVKIPLLILDLPARQ